MIPICVCPCGHTLADDGKTCIDNQECPFDISLWLDGTTSACASSGYDDAQKSTMANIADFFSVEVKTGGTENGQLAPTCADLRRLAPTCADWPGSIFKT
jgi:hypothetical protein